MKRLKTLTSILVLSIFGMVIYFSACRPNPCVTRAVNCLNGGTCRDGYCICAAGYEGDSCSKKVNEKFQSKYACIRTKLKNGTIPDDNDDTLRINAHPTKKFEISIYSIRDSFVEVFPATVNNNFITVPEIIIDSSKYRGSGSLNNGILTLTIYQDSVYSSYTEKRTYVGYKF